MNFYVEMRKDNAISPLGSDRNVIFHDLKTLRGAINRANKIADKLGYNKNLIRVYTFTDVYEEASYKQVYGLN